MRAIVIREHGGYETLRISEAPTPEPSASEVRVRVAAVGVNHLDLWVRSGVPGHKFPLPLIAGSDVAGVVDKVGSDVHHVRSGDEVIVAPGVSCGQCKACSTGHDHYCKHYGILGEHRDGGDAENVVVPGRNIFLKPKNLSFVQAASIGVPFMTAWHMVVHRAKVQPGEVVLVQGASSGVSVAAIQMAKMWGATVIAASTSEAKRKKARELGADHVVDSSDPQMAKTVRQIAPDGVHVVIEHVGKATWDHSLKALGWQGRLVICGATTGADVSLNLRHLFFKSQSILGSTMGSLGELYAILGHIAAGRLRPVVDRALPLSDIATAHQLLDSRQIFGKIVLTL